MRYSSKSIQFILLGFILVMIIACSEDDKSPMEPVLYDDSPYTLRIGSFPPPSIPSDNSLTVQGVHLGKMLFYEPMLSKNNEQSCASCHRLEHAFTDTARFSIGVEELPGTRQAMSVFNMAWNSNEFFWDGRAHLLRDQSLLPIQDSLEMNETLDNVIAKLSASQMYRDQFVRTFGTEEITATKMSLAMEQFMLSVVSMDSKYDRYLSGEESLSPSEERGRVLYFAEYNPFFPDISGADCQHCHGGLNFENDDYLNNGLDTDLNFNDEGRADVTENPYDRAKFKVPSLRNIELTAPYMHDGRFSSLEEVIDHYNEGIQVSSTLDGTLVQTVDNGLLLDAQDKADLIAFLKTLTDQVFINNDEYKDPHM